MSKKLYPYPEEVKAAIRAVYNNAGSSDPSNIDNILAKTPVELFELLDLMNLAVHDGRKHPELVEKFDTLYGLVENLKNTPA